MDHTKSISTSQGPLSVKRCGCGGIHICIGGISLNLAKETALFLQGELNRACLEEAPTPESTLTKLRFSPVLVKN